ncbi:esterase [Cavenderia fasciculata]|uniref:S-formylglutathione hydrolase n=1 Tax=Cavenderia fasciculata TaxID=261658 RepID=F4Q1A0_CACFS|nr:esterase [Cavenderia fasciculata]EGG18601.1 esterase [Cavenderia fasciculata]|eukprot:XP_004366505.1 esterase [Cavenderia fasciculata]
MAIQLVSKSRCFNGEVRRYSHLSSSLQCEMKFHVFVPDNYDSKENLACLWFLSGLTCTDENFITKAGAIKSVSQGGIMLVCPDTSPRGTNIEGEKDSWDHGQGAGFYVDATVEKWANNYNMYTYVTEELYNIINIEFKTKKHSIFGHSMGGHGALVMALRNPTKYQSVSAFAPICNPTQVPWGKKNLGGYLGQDNLEAWNQYDATVLANKYTGVDKINILVDQGDADEFLERELKPSALKEACEANPLLSLTLRMQPGYNHNYYFIQTFVDDHINFHLNHLK